MKNRHFNIFWPVILSMSICIFQFTSCYHWKRYESCTLPANPVNMGEINSVYDDYNSDIPTVGENSPLCFSSNRNSQGKDFDIVFINLEVQFNRSTGELYVGEYRDSGWEPNPGSSNLNKAVTRIKSQFDELGPYLIPLGDGYIRSGGNNIPYQKYLFLYASNDTGNLDIKITDNTIGYGYSQPVRVKFLNSGKNDAYPTMNQNNNTVFFCSDRDGDFDIYSADINEKISLLAALHDTTTRAVVKNTVLSSDGDDKCPFIIGNRMVFTSNRAGGYGGFDLYYSIFVNGSWSAPENFGPEINTEYDEYRPVFKVFQYYFKNDLMIFSSNRPGGLGGFDLYYVGIDKLLN